MDDLRALQRVVTALSWAAAVAGARCAVIVPTTAAGWQLRRTLVRLLEEDAWRLTSRDAERLGLPDPSSAPHAMALDGVELLTRDAWYARLHEACAPAIGRWIPDLEREVLLQAACEDAVASGNSPPFAVRPGLMPQILELYDAMRRRRRGVEDFERLLRGSLEPSAEHDRGARRMLRQTRFLAAALRAYEGRLAALDVVDEHRCRDRIHAGPGASPHAHLVLTTADVVADGAGLWPADFDLLTRLPGLRRMDVVATEQTLGAGFHGRLQELLPGIEECRPRDGVAVAPRLVAPPRGVDRLFFLARDREEELAGAVRRIASAVAPRGDRAPDRVALVYQRPLPYLYLGRGLLDDAGVPYDAEDTLPLAAEPFAAVLHVVCDFVLSRHARRSILALLRTPHLRFQGDGRRVDGAAVAALEAVMRERSFAGGRDALAALADALSGRTGGAGPDDAAAGAARAATAAASELIPLESPGRVTLHLNTLAAFLDGHDPPIAEDAAWVTRHRRARAAVMSAIHALRAAHAAHADRVGSFSDVAASLLRRIEGHTFSPRLGCGGVQLVDAQAARFGSFAQVHLLGLVEGEWPAPALRDVFYPSSLLRELGWPGERDRTAAARAAFLDLLRLADEEVSLSAFQLEDDAIVRTAPLLEDLDHAALAVHRLERDAFQHLAVDDAHGGAGERGEAPAGPGDAAAWLALRTARSDRDGPEFHGFTGGAARPAESVSAIETYLDCPFRYFASRVLRLEEERPEEPGLDAREHGRFVHLVFQRFFEEWDAAGHGAVTLDTLPLARTSFANLVDDLLDTLPEPDRALERTRLLGSPVAAGLGERVFRLEIERAAGVIERRLEADLAGEYEFETAGERRRVSLRGIADRVDLLQGGGLRLVDYKTGAAPDRDRAVQLPIYALCAEAQLAGHRGRTWRTTDAAYIAFGESRPYVAVIDGPDARDAAVADAQGRFVATLDAIGRGEFPPRPATWRLCATCAWADACRKDYVDAG